MREITTLRREKGGKEGERDGERGRERGREGGREGEGWRERKGEREEGREGEVEEKKEMARLTLLAILYHPYLHHKILHCSDYVYLYHENIK